MKFFVLASLLALAVAEPVHHMKHYGDGVVAPEKTPEVKAAEAMHYAAKANAEVYKAAMPHVYTYPQVHTPYVYAAPKVHTPVVYTAPKVHTPTVVYKAPEVEYKTVEHEHVSTPAVQRYVAPVTYTTQYQQPLVYTHQNVAPVTYTTHHSTPFVYTHHLAKREAEADPQVFYNTYGYYPQQQYYTNQYVMPYTYNTAAYTYQNVAPVTYTTQYQQPLVYTHHLAKREAEADPQVFYNTYGYYPQQQYYTNQFYGYNWANTAYNNYVRYPAQYQYLY